MPILKISQSGIDKIMSNERGKRVQCSISFYVNMEKNISLNIPHSFSVSQDQVDKVGSVWLPLTSLLESNLTLKKKLHYKVCYNINRKFFSSVPKYKISPKFKPPFPTKVCNKDLT